MRKTQPITVGFEDGTWLQIQATGCYKLAKESKWGPPESLQKGIYPS